MEKELENPEKKKKRKQSSRPTKPSQAARPRHLTGGPRMSAAVLPRARPPSLARCLVGPICRCPFFSLARSLSRGPGSPVAEPLPRTPLFFSLCAVGLPCQFCPLRARRGPTRAHSRTSPDFSAMTPAHAPNSLLRAPPVPRAHPSPHFAQLYPLSRSAHAASRRRRPAPAFPAIQLAGDRSKPPRASPRGETPVPCPISSIAPCARPISHSLVLGRGGPPYSRGGRPI
jgi:hypothetical protein